MQITDKDFQKEVIKSSIPVMVDFWASWCGPCKAISPIVDKFAKEYDGKVKILKMDIEKNQETAMQYQVQSLPTLLFFKKGVIVDRKIGTATEKDMRARIENLMG